MMAESLRALRRGAMQLVIRQAIMATSALPIGLQRSVVGSIVTLAGGILRWKVRENMRLALGHDVPAQTESLYFRHVGWALSNALSTFHYGIAATPVPQAVKFDESVRLLDEAVAEGRGVVLVGPHWSAHELVAAIISRRHPMAMLVRQASSSDRAARKLKWYDALGVEIVLRPSRASAIKDAVACLKVLKRGNCSASLSTIWLDPGKASRPAFSDAPRGSTAVLSPLRSRRGRQWYESLAGGNPMRACWSCLTAHHSLSMPAIVMPPFAPVFRAGVCGLRRNCGQIQRTGYSGSTDAGHASCVRPRAGLVPNERSDCTGGLRRSLSAC